MHQRPWNSVAKPASGPLCSVPATGWPGTIVASGSAARSAASTLAFDAADIADDRVGGQIVGELAPPTAPIAPTGTHRITRSASITAAPALSATSSARSSPIARARTAGSAS